jgi:hypothetical protein
MVRILVPAAWARHGRREFEASEGPLHSVIKAFCAAYPDYRWRLLDADGEPATYLNFYLDNEPLPRRECATAAIPAGSTVIVCPPLTGG